MYISGFRWVSFWVNMWACVCALQENIPTNSIFNFIYILAYFVVKFHFHQFRHSHILCTLMMMTTTTTQQRKKLHSNERIEMKIMTFDWLLKIGKESVIKMGRERKVNFMAQCVLLILLCLWCCYWYYCCVALWHRE